MIEPNWENYEKFKQLNLIKQEYGYLLWKYGTADNVEIEDILVEDKEQRKGVGRSLIIELLNAVSPKIIFVYTKVHNLIAQKFYENMGFKRGGIMGDNILYWQKYEILKEKLCKEI